MRSLASSLRTRLLVASLAWIAVALLLTGAVLVVLFRTHIERRFDASLHDHLEEIAAAAEVGDDGRLKLTWEPADPRFKPPLSGWYWEIRAGSRVLRRSASLGEASLPIASFGPGQPYQVREIYWPDDECLRIMVQDIRLPEKDEALTVLVAGPRREIRADVREFARLLGLALTVLALALGAMALLQVGYGLKPLAAMRNTLNEIRSGSRTRLDVDGSPRELLPLVDEINDLLAEREQQLERAKAEAGDLAHALKTPIAIIANEAAPIPGEAGEVLRSETRRVQRVVEHHLVRARAAAAASTRRGIAQVEPILEDVRFAIGKLHPELKVDIRSSGPLQFAGASDDLGEMVGNLADNAGKWARTAVSITADRRGNRLHVSVEDDGPGMNDTQCAAALARGERLDAGDRADRGKAGSHGLGLSIVAQLAALYGGSISLGRSPLGGLQAVLDLPAGGEPK